MLASPSLPESEFRDRIDRAREKISDAGVNAGIWFNATSIESLSHFYHVQTERPVALVITGKKTVITVPKLEVMRVQKTPLLTRPTTFSISPGRDR